MSLFIFLLQENETDKDSGTESDDENNNLDEADLQCKFSLIYFPCIFVLLQTQTTKLKQSKLVRDVL